MLLLLLFAATLVRAENYPTWCGKHYQLGAPLAAPHPSTRFPIPPLSPTPLLDFQCAQAVTPYIEGDDTSVLIDLLLNHRRGVDWGTAAGPLTISVEVGGQRVGGEVLEVGARAQKIEIDLSGVAPRREPYSLRCRATREAGGVLEVDGKLRYLSPSSYGGSVVRQDAATGGLLTLEDDRWTPFFPLGFYVQFGGFLETNLTVLDDMKARGFNVFHPVPTFDNLTALDLVLDRAEELGLWLMYDMRWSYMDLDSVRKQVELIRRRKNLLLWYTADEPDGPSDPLDAPRLTYDLIQELDGYHPVSLVLNCADFQWAPYSAGADILLTDPYPLHLNTSFSPVYHTSCDSTFGCCGCDNCIGSLEDVSYRVDTSFDRRFLSGRERNLSVWMVPQALGNSEFWTGIPSERDFLAMAVLGILHGVTGILPWTLPTSSEVLQGATKLASLVPYLKSFILDASATSTNLSTNASAVQARLWTVNAAAFLLVTNSANESVVAKADFEGLLGVGDWRAMLQEGVEVLEDGGEGMLLALEPFGTGGWVRQTAEGGEVAVELVLQG
ncbi:hypothetical protein BCR35DRAFT_296149 [Leucosporidium creatinivorum]|uniref:Glycoside hydrolase superfamily n=1 Tax=Leucosporidium creatinivorum TaxID=106004 RepID=A0A1Y2DC25_9BASI|nr:hypothetical protein BCR35DRAFT_296149 [Leucosporidium creatinivorum]